MNRLREPECKVVPKLFPALTFHWDGKEPNASWPTWMMAAFEEYHLQRRSPEELEDRWPVAAVSICGQNTPGVFLTVSRPFGRGALKAFPGDWIVRSGSGQWDVYDEATFKETFNFTAD